MDTDLLLAHRLADAAGAVIRPLFRAPHDLTTKDDQSPVTAADRGAEAAIRELLAAERPSDGILGEEFAPAGLDQERVWVIDPIDGTRAFITGKPTFTTLIALWEQGRPRLGLIDQPITGERWVGKVGNSATWNGRPVRSRACPALDRAVMLATAPELFETPGDRAAFDRVQARAGHFSWGGDAYGYALVAMGAADLVIEMGLKAYDFAALVPLFAAAGGVITDWDGQPLTLASEGKAIAAGDPTVHAEALALLQGRS